MTDEQGRLKAIRQRLSLSQSEFARELGLTLRGVQDIEAGKGKERAAYIMAAEYLALRIAVAQQKPELAGEETRRLAKELSA